LWFFFSFSPEENEKIREEKDETKSEKKRGRPGSWVHGYMTEEGKYLVCQFNVRKRMEDGSTALAPCGKKCLYITGPSNTKSTSTAKAHLIKDHNFTKKGERPLKQVALETKGSMVHLDSNTKWTPLDPNTQRLNEEIAKWFTIDGKAPYDVSKAG
jgi:hypothetical protein